MVEGETRSEHRDPDATYRHDSDSYDHAGARLENEQGSDSRNVAVPIALPEVDVDVGRPHQQEAAHDETRQRRSTLSTS